MVDTQLQTATDDLVGVFTHFDPVAIVTGAAGLGIGLFSADFIAALASDMLHQKGGVAQMGVEILTKLGLTGALAMARGYIGSPMIGVLIGLAAVGSGVSAVLQVIEAVAQTAAGISTGQVGPTGGSPQQSRVTQNAYSQSASSGDGQTSDLYSVGA